MKRQALWFGGPGRIELRDESLPAPAEGQLLIRTLVSAISAGTELLIYRDQAPPELAVDETLPALAGSFHFPLKYGYAAVGRVEQLGPGVPTDWLDRLVFAFNPHESHFLANPADLLALPDDLSPEQAAFVPNVETALTLLLDGQPLVGEQVAVFGQGVVGLLVTALLARLPLASLVSLDRWASRRVASLALGASASLDPAEPAAASRLAQQLQGPRSYSGADLVFELSGDPTTLDQALTAAGFNARIVIGSWYGRKRASLDLGGRFHRARQHLIASQVSTLPPELTGRWTKERRLQTVLELIPSLDPARLITHRFALADAGAAYSLLDRHPDDAIQVLLTY
jgi:2-desacetyl-2-hydroxyethyl bacteriochlorophyllide A dehydrogenase